MAKKKVLIKIYFCDNGLFCDNFSCGEEYRKIFGGDRPFEFQREKYGKPIIKNYDNIYFSKSHSGFYCLSAYTEGVKIGVDIECREGTSVRHTRVANRFFSEREYEHILMSDDPFSEFFSLWVKKEAVIKESGEGLQALSRTHLRGDSFDLFPGKTVIDLKNYPPFSKMKGFYGAICLDGENLSADIEVINYNKKESIQSL